MSISASASAGWAFISSNAVVGIFSFALALCYLLYILMLKAATSLLKRPRHKLPRLSERRGAATLLTSCDVSLSAMRI